MNKKTCFYCGEDDPKIPYQKDHIFGRNLSDETVWTCLNCHAKKTHYQNKLSPSIRKKSASNLAKQIYGMNSIGSTLILIGEKLVKFSEVASKEMKKCGLI
jgi:hypothetical protein